MHITIQLNLILLLCILAPILVNCKNHVIIWHSDLIPDALKGATLKVKVNDQLTLRCPGFAGSDEYYQYTKIYMVSKTEWDSCMLIKPKWIGICNNASIDTTIKLTFRTFSPVPNGFEYKVGELYYITTTSSGRKDGISQNAFGLCQRERLKLKILVQDKNSVIPPTTTTANYYADYENWHANDQIMTYQIHNIGELEALEAKTTSKPFTIIAIVWIMTTLLLKGI